MSGAMEGKKGGGTSVSTEGKKQEEKPAEEKEKKPAAEEDKKGGDTPISTEGKEQSNFGSSKHLCINAGEHLEKVEMIIKSLFEEYSHEMGGSFDDHSEEVGVDEVAEIDNPLADWEAHLRVQKKQETTELDRYLSDDLFPQEKNFDILEWWQMHNPKYPVLSRIARDVLAIQASTVASESSFSAGGRTISDHRNRLKSDTVEALTCLQDWLNSDDPKRTNKDVEEEEYLGASVMRKPSSRTTKVLQAGVLQTALADQ